MRKLNETTIKTDIKFTKNKNYFPFWLINQLFIPINFKVLSIINTEKLIEK